MILLVGTRNIGENRKVVFHNLLANSLETSGVLRQERTSLLVSREIDWQQIFQPVFERPEEDLLSDLNDNLFFLTVSAVRHFFLFILATDETRQLFGFTELRVKLTLSSTFQTAFAREK